MQITGIISSALITLLLVLICPNDGRTQQLHFAGTLQCELTHNTIPNAHIKVIDKYTHEVILQYQTNENGEYDFLCPASERVILNIESPFFHVKRLTYFDLNEWQLNGSESLQMTPVSNDRFTYTIELEEPVKRPIHLNVIDLKNETQILDYLETEFPIRLPLMFSNKSKFRISIHCPGYFSAIYDIHTSPSGNVTVSRSIPYDQDSIIELNDVGQYGKELIHYLRLCPIKLDMNIEIKGISYKPGESYIEPSSARVLDRVIDFVASHPELTFELGSHSNDWNNDLKNLDLSTLRANVAVDYLVEKGDISSQRISAKGYGPFQMKKDCPGLESCGNIKVLKSHEHSRTILKVIDIHSTGSSIQKKSNNGSYKIDQNGVRGRNEIKEMQNPIDQEAEFDIKGNIKETEKFSGQAIQLLFTSKPLPDSHAVFSHKDLLIDFNRDKRGYAYLVKTGKRNSQIMDELKEIRTTYADAFVVSYLNGKRVQ